jgi:hypothetical protein
MFSLFLVLFTLCLPVIGYLADNNSLAKGFFLHSSQLCARSFVRGFISVFAGTYLCEKSMYFNVYFRFLVLCTSCLHVIDYITVVKRGNKRIIIIIIIIITCKVDPLSPRHCASSGCG